jgi:8-amino-7-oxononanoate synthase
MSRWFDWAKAKNAEIDAANLRREIHDFEPVGPKMRWSDGRVVTSFGSNDYLGLSQHPAVIAGARAAIDRYGAGSGSARLIAGSRPIHSELETEIAEWKSKERALLFPTGYAANLGVLSTLGTQDTIICSDELNHASIVDACRLARADVQIYPHRDVHALDDILKGSTKRAIVVSDSVFSMDGDVAPIEELADVCARYDAILVLDEAHAVLGPEPSRAEIDRIRVGTLSKFLGALGGFVAADAEFIDLFTNTARSFIFTTALSPADAGAALAALRVLRSDEGDALKKRLRDLVDIVDANSPSPIVPIAIGDEVTALTASKTLLERGFFVPAIRPPSVPDGTSRLRISISAAHDRSDVEGLVAALDELTPERSHA